MKAVKNYCLLTPSITAAVRGISPAALVGHLHSERGGLRAVADPEVGVRTAAVVVEVGDVERLRVQDLDVSRGYLKMGQRKWPI